MGSPATGLRRLGVCAAAVCALLGGAPVASAAPGAVLRDLVPPGPAGGVSVAFDGQYLYTTDAGGAVLHRVAPSGAVAGDIPILGGVAINALTYDATHDVFWGVGATGIDIYRIEKDGFAALQFSIVPILDLPGLCDVLAGCDSVVSGLAYDAATDSLWYLPRGSERVYHFDTSGQLLGWFDTNDGSGALVPDCLGNGAAGIAAGANALYLTAGSCGRGFQYAKSDDGAGAKLSSFALPGSSADAECDNVTFPATAIWVRDTSTGHLRAIEVAPGTCALGGGIPLANPNETGWMSGAGQAFSQEGLPVQHAFHVLCAQSGNGPPNNMVINWRDVLGNRYSFHLELVTTLDCFYDGTVAASPPPCDPIANPDCFNTIVGDGVGRLIGRSPGGTIILGSQRCDPNAVPTDCGSVSFRFTDRGEPNLQVTQPPPPPGTFDDGEFVVSDAVQGGILLACGCTRANYQAHNQQQ